MTYSILGCPLFIQCPSVSFSQTGKIKCLSVNKMYWIMSPHHLTYTSLNSLVPGRCGSNSKRIIFKLIIWICSLGTHCEIALRWMPWNLNDKKLTLVEVLARHHHVTSHHLRQYWPISMSPYDITRWQLVNNPSTTIPHSSPQKINDERVQDHYIPREQGSWGQHGAHLGPVSPSWAPCWPHGPCYQGYYMGHKHLAFAGCTMWVMSTGNLAWVHTELNALWQ